MELETIGRNLRRYRKAKKLRQEDLAERTGLSTNYIGSMERGEKIPSLETFIVIVNALGISADMLLADVVESGYTVKTSLLAEKLEAVSSKDRERIYDVVDALLKHTEKG